jgi:aspartate ammonia-lyase
MSPWKKQTQYESEITKFINDLKQKNPKLEEGQREGRALLWDKEPIDLDQRTRAEESMVKQQAYVYQTH